MQIKWLFFIFVFIISFRVNAQGEIDDEAKSSIRHERVWHLTLNSNGWGGGYSWAKMQTIFRKTLWNFELVTIHDLKEYKQNPANYDGRRFVYGKLNSLYCIRSQYGIQKQMFAKRDKGGIEIRYYFTTGLDLAFLKPIYYNYSDDKVRKFEEQHSATIQSRAPFYKGLSETNLVPGVNITGASSFEFSKRDKVINALEGGLILDVFPQKIEIMANDYNKIWFLSFFISYKFGKIVNPRVRTENEITGTNK